MENLNVKAEKVLGQSGLVVFWDFQEIMGENRVSKGPFKYSLVEKDGEVEQVKDGIFGQYSARLGRSSWLNLPRKNCSALHFHGKMPFTIVAWIKREGTKKFDHCEAIAGIWDETGCRRQYCLFLNLHIWESAEQVCGHVSTFGGPTPGYKYAMDCSIGQTKIPLDEWQSVAFSWDGESAYSYLNGKLDRRETWNPFYFGKEIYNGGENGADFTVGAVNRSGVMGNFFTGLLGGLAVFNKCLSENEINSMNG